MGVGIDLVDTSPAVARVSYSGAGTYSLGAGTNLKIETSSLTIIQGTTIGMESALGIRISTLYVIIGSIKMAVVESMSGERVHQTQSKTTNIVEMCLDRSATRERQASG